LDSRAKVQEYFGVFPKLKVRSVPETREWDYDIWEGNPPTRAIFHPPMLLLLLRHIAYTPH